MTLIVTALSDHCVVQVVDRRLTLPDGKLYDDMAIKTICVACQDAAFSMSYTGLAEINRVRTDILIVDYLASIHAGRLSFSEIVESLQMYLNETFCTLSSLGDRRGITFALAGFSHGQPFMAILSNMEEKGKRLEKGIDDNFHASFITRNQEPIRKLGIVIHGAEQASDVILPHVNIIRKRYLNEAPQRISMLLMNLIRRSSHHRKWGKLIGENCLGVIVFPDGNFLSIDYPEKTLPRENVPHLILPNGAYKGIEIWTEEPPERR